jgi:cold-inducible RNA-binding protein
VFKIFVGGLAWATDSDSLREAFSKFGKVTEAKVLTDRETGKSRGFGFVSFEFDSEGYRAIEEMNEQTLDGRTIRVNEAEQKPAGRGPGGGAGRPSAPREPVVEMMRRRGPASNASRPQEDGTWSPPDRGPKNRKSGNRPPEKDFVDPQRNR